MAETTWDTRKLLFRQDVVADHAIFATAEIRGIMFVSDGTRSACEAAGLTGLAFDHSFPVR